MSAVVAVCLCCRQGCRQAAQDTTSNKALNKSKKTGNTVHKKAQADANPSGSSAAGRGRGGSKPGGAAGASSHSKGGVSGTGGAGKAGGDSCSIGNSFVPGTKVLMADGSTKRIEDVKPGDKVKAPTRKPVRPAYAS